jgi:hypothetical protein
MHSPNGLRLYRLLLDKRSNIWSLQRPATSKSLEPCHVFCLRITQRITLRRLDERGEGLAGSNHLQGGLGRWAMGGLSQFRGIKTSQADALHGSPLANAHGVSRINRHNRGGRCHPWHETHQCSQPVEIPAPLWSCSVMHPIAAPCLTVQATSEASV